MDAELMQETAEVLLLRILEGARANDAHLSPEDLKVGNLCTRIIELSKKRRSIHPRRLVTDEEIDRRLERAWSQLVKSGLVDAETGGAK